jgi:hypothetical protein
MSEQMKSAINLDPSTLLVKIHDEPIKNTNNELTITKDELSKQADFLRESMTAVDYGTVRGTCGDERFRVGLKSGEEKVEARPSVFGGPNIYGLYIMELAGMFKGSTASPDERLRQTTRDLNRNKIASGGHEHCAAAAGFAAVIENGESNAALVKAYAKENMSNYDESLMNEVLDNASRLVEEMTYEGWDGEAALLRVLGNEANEAIERLADMPHKGRTLARQKRPGYTIDQTRVHELSDGEDSFDHDDPYADRIENALAAGPKASRVKQLMEHAREFVLVGVALAVPNPELHQIDIS